MEPSYESLSCSRHSCCYCQKIVIEPSASTFNDASQRQTFQSFINSFEFSLTEIVESSENNCVLFQRIRRDLTEDFVEHPPPNLQWWISNHPDRRIRLHFQIEPATLDAINSTPSYACLVSWLWEWANEATNMPSWYGVDRYTYELCSEPENPAAELVKQRPQYPYIASEATFRFVQEASRECDFHPACLIKSHGYSEQRPGASRLIDVRPLKDGNIHITTANDTMQYVALSYCWGNEDSMKLTSAVLKNWEEVIEFSLLPKTLKDVVICTRGLGVRYLWVDRLCIIQDDERDKAIEITAMPQIYSRAYLTISAASAKSSGDGFLNTREEVHEVLAHSWVELPYLSSRGARGLVTLKLSEPCEDFNSPNTQAIDSRAWTMQEQMLSPRLLHFCTFHIVWRCKVRERIGTSEAIEQSLPAWTRERNVSQIDSTFSSWKDIVRRYTKRKLSYPDDKLIAISAVAQAYGSIHSGAISQHSKILLQEQTSKFKSWPKAYVAGIWRHEMPFALCWWRPWDCKSESRPLFQRAPSWSWASVDGPIAYYEPMGGKASYNTNVKVLECDVTLRSSLQEYGAVSGGELKLRGRLKGGFQLHYNKSNVNLQDRNGIKKIINIFPDSKDNPLGHSDRMITAFILQMGDSIGCLWSGTQELRGPYGLILLPVDDKTFKRIGFFQAGLDLGFDSCSFQDIIVV